MIVLLALVILIGTLLALKFALWTVLGAAIALLAVLGGYGRDRRRFDPAPQSTRRVNAPR